MTTLVWSESAEHPGEWTATTGAATFIISAGWPLPDIRKWNVHLTHSEMERDDNGETALLYRGWGHTVDDAKALAQLICDAPLGDDTARLDWMRRHQAELAEEVATHRAGCGPSAT